MRYKLTLEFGEKDAPQILELLAMRPPTVGIAEVTCSGRPDAERSLLSGYHDTRRDLPQPTYQPPRPVRREKLPEPKAYSETSARRHLADDGTGAPAVTFENAPEGTWVLARWFQEGSTVRYRVGRVCSWESDGPGEALKARVLCASGVVLLRSSTDLALHTPSVNDWSEWSHGAFRMKWSGRGSRPSQTPGR